jgi:predicted PurR-regulated permease PerM
VAIDRPIPSTVQVTPAPSEPAPASVGHAQQAWRRLGYRLRSITPSGLARFVLALGAIGVVGWLLSSAWVDLLPFQFGFVLAYITLPLVDWLDRFMPRALAAISVVLIELLSVGLFFSLLIPPIAGEVASLASSLPTSFEPRAFAAQLSDRAQALPEPVRQVIAEAARQATNTVRDNLALYLRNGANLVVSGTLGLFATLGFILGFLAIPTWLISVLTDQQRGQRTVNRFLPDWLRGDFWSVAQILDRTLGTYVRGQVMAGLAVGAATFVGLALLKHFFWPELHYLLLLAMVAAVLNLIPTIGPIVAAVPAVLVGAFIAPEAAAAILGLYVLIQQLEATFVQPLIMRGSEPIHPSILVVVLVVLSQFGFLWVLFGTPLAVALRDLFRYAYGRLGDPPLPAGVLPGGSPLVPPRRVPTMARAGLAIAAPQFPIAAHTAEALAFSRMRHRRGVSALPARAGDVGVSNE